MNISFRERAMMTFLVVFLVFITFIAFSFGKTVEAGSNGEAHYSLEAVDLDTSLMQVNFPAIEGMGVVVYDPSRIWAATPVCTGSMEPTLGCHDVLLFYDPEKPSEIDRGDIISYESFGSCGGRLHRVLSVGYDSSLGEVTFTTKGDTSILPDFCQVPFSAVNGKVLAVVYDSNL